MWTMWGNSSRDLYMVGFNDVIYHYDGQAWQTQWLSIGPGMPITHSGDYFGVYGFGPSNVFAVGGTSYGVGHDSSLVIHFDGSRWAEQVVEGGRDLLTVWGSGPHDVWTGGHAGSLFHYDGVSWRRAAIDANIDVKEIRGVGPNDIYFLGIRYYSSDYTTNLNLIGHYDGNRWSVIDSMNYAGPKFGASRLGIVGTTLYSVGYFGIYSFRNGQWMQEVQTPRGLAGMCASGPRNAYAVGSDMYHFDGATWSQVTDLHFENRVMQAVWCNENEVFCFVPLYPAGNAVIHGK